MYSRSAAASRAGSEVKRCSADMTAAVLSRQGAFCAEPDRRSALFRSTGHRRVAHTGHQSTIPVPVQLQPRPSSSTYIGTFWTTRCIRLRTNPRSHTDPACHPDHHPSQLPDEFAAVCRATQRPDPLLHPSGSSHSQRLATQRPTASAARAARSYPSPSHPSPRP